MEPNKEGIVLSHKKKKHVKINKTSLHENKTESCISIQSFSFGGIYIVVTQD